MFVTFIDEIMPAKRHAICGIPDRELHQAVRTVHNFLLAFFVLYAMSQSLQSGNYSRHGGCLQ